MNEKNLGLIALLSTMLLAAGLLVVAPLAGQENYALDGNRVAIYNLAGQVELIRGSGSEVTVEVTRAGEDADQLEIRRNRALHVGGAW